MHTCRASKCFFDACPSPTPTPAVDVVHCYPCRRCKTKASPSWHNSQLLGGVEEWRRTESSSRVPLTLAIGAWYGFGLIPCVKRLELAPRVASKTYRIHKSTGLCEIKHQQPHHGRRQWYPTREHNEALSTLFRGHYQLTQTTHACYHVPTLHVEMLSERLCQLENVSLKWLQHLYLLYICLRKQPNK